MKDLALYKLILGSGSPRRKQLLEECGFNITVRTKEIDETPPPGFYRAEMAMKLAEMKADALISTLEENEILITADTIVCIDELVLNKPADESHATEMLEMLSGKTHQVYTGVCLTGNNHKNIFSCETDVEFNVLDEKMIKHYIRNFSPFDKAGSYGAQECLPARINPCSETEKEFMLSIGKPDLFEKTLVQSSRENVALIKKVKGSYFNVMGLPVVELSNHLRTILN